MADRVIWAQKLEHAGAADCLADTILKAVAAHPDAVMQVEVDAILEIDCVAVLADADDPDNSVFWKVVLYDVQMSVGDEV